MSNVPRFQEIETPRLLLRRFTEAELPTFVAYRNDPDIARYRVHYFLFGEPAL